MAETLIEIGKLRGPQGDRGPMGDVGPRGPEGVQGPIGPRGLPGTFTSAGATSVSAGEPARVELTGEELYKHAQFFIPRGLPGVNALPAADAVATYIRAVDSEVRQALNGSFLQRGSQSASQATPYVEVNNQGEAATLHLTGSGTAARPYIVGIGNDEGASPGLLIANKAGGAGFYLDNHPTATGNAMFGAQRSSATFARLISTVSGANPLLEIQSQAGLSAQPAQPLLRIMEGNGVVATFLRGKTQFHKNVDVYAGQLLMTENVDLPNSQRSGVFMLPTGLVFKSTAGNEVSWFNTRLNAEGGQLSLEGGGAWGFNNGGNFSKIITVTSDNKLGFFGKAPIAQQARLQFPEAGWTTAQLNAWCASFMQLIINTGLIGS